MSEPRLLRAAFMLLPVIPFGGTLAVGQSLSTELVAGGFSSPVYLTSPPGESNRLFVLEQNTGRIEIIKNGTVLSTAFLNIGSDSSGGGERGLLGMAFHPDYASNGRFFVNFTNNQGNTRVWEYQVSADPDVADPNMVRNIQAVGQPFSNHNGGCIQFGADGMLYIGMGDGGSANDPSGRAQDLGQRLGKILRLDVDIPPPFIPADNPFVGQPGAEEAIWALGIRNPWRFSFDSATGDLWIGDVGQNSREEIDFQPAASTGGENYGWRCMEGTSCTGLSGCTCNDSALTMPVHTYGHNLGCSVTGGYVYRGAAVWLSGTYFFGDYCSARIWSMRYDGNNVTEFTERTGELDPPGSDSIDNISSFGEDGAGNLYIIDHGGQVYRVIADCYAENFCGTTPNSAGPGAVLSASGSMNLSDNAFTVSTTGGVPGQFGYYLYGTSSASTPVADGVLCVGGSIFRVLPPQGFDASGNVARTMDFTSPPFTGGGSLVAGSSYYWTRWYRDPPGGPSGSNFSDGLHAIFCP